MVPGTVEESWGVGLVMLEEEHGIEVFLEVEGHGMKVVAVAVVMKEEEQV